MIDESPLTTFQGSWSEAEKDLITEAVREVEPQFDAPSLPDELGARWLLQHTTWGETSVYIAHRWGLDRAVIAPTAQTLAREVLSLGGEDPPE